MNKSYYSHQRANLMHRVCFDCDAAITYDKTLGAEELEREVIWMAYRLFPNGYPSGKGKRWNSILDFLQWFDRKYPHKPY